MLIAEKNRPLLSQYTGPSTVNRSAKTISFKGEMSNASLIIERSTLEDYTHANGTLLLFGEKIENLDCKISAIFME